MKNVLKALGSKPKDHDIETCIRRVGTPTTGTIKIEGMIIRIWVFSKLYQIVTATTEFMLAFAPILSREASNREIQLLFIAFDKDKDEVISIDNLRYVMEITGQSLSTEELHAIMQELDVDGDSVVTCEFLSLIFIRRANTTNRQRLLYICKTVLLNLLERS